MAKQKLIIIPGFNPYSIARKAANQSIPNAAITQVLLDTLIVEDGITFNAGANNFPVYETGIYSISFSVQFALNNTGIRGYRIFVNGVNRHTQTLAPASLAGNLVGSFSSVLMQLFSNDVVDLRVFQSSGAALNILATNPDTPSMGIIKLA